MSLYGMDLEQGEHLARELTRASQRFAQLSGQLTPVITAGLWRGPDGEQFRGDWKSHSRMLLAASQALRDASEAVRENVRQQQDASSGRTGDGQPAGSVHVGGNAAAALLGSFLTGAGDAAGDLWDGTGEVFDTVGGKVGDGLGWLGGRASASVSNLGDAGSDVFGGLGDVGGLGWDFLSTGEPPSVTELLAGGTGLLAAGLNANVALSTAGILHPHLLDDGSPVAGNPQTVGVGSDPALNGHRSTPVPSSLAQIMGGVTAAYDDGGKSGTPDAAVRITVVDKGDGPAYIVTIPGTSEWNVRSGTNPMDTVGNLSSAAGSMSTASQAVEMAMVQAGIPRDAPVMLVGHSQGGMTAANLAADPEFRRHFDVTNVMTYGSPIDSTRIPADVKTLALQHPFDVVPRLDLGNSKPLGTVLVGWESSNGATVVTLPSPAGSGMGDVVGNHDYNAYAASVEANESSGALAAYRNDPSTQAFITAEPGQVRSAASGIGRKE
jgi:pimeloyl-ACP methyl ester carboxylesterase